MKSKFKFLLIVFLSFSTIFPQNARDISAGVIDFLLRNPKTANRMNSTESIALDIIGDLLKQKSERNYNLDYAKASSNQLTINTNDGRQAQFVKNSTGDVYLLLDGIIHPIATELVNIAMGTNSSYSNANDTGFYEIDRDEMKKMFNKSVSDLYYIKAIYPFKWYRDLNGNNAMDFDEIKQLQGTFFHNENFRIGIHYTLPKMSEVRISVKILNNYSGSEMYSEIYSLQNITNKPNNWIIYDWFFVESNTLPFGEYLIVASLQDVNTTQTLSSHSQRFNIVEGDSTTNEPSIFITNENDYRNKRLSQSTPQGLFFWSNWNDKNKDNRYDIDEILGIDKKTYSLSKDNIMIGLNFSDIRGEYIIQSKTKNGDIIGTTTNKFQKINNNGIYLESNPYIYLDFIDRVQINGPGEYIITVSFVEGGTFEKELVITE